MNEQKKEINPEEVFYRLALSLTPNIGAMSMRRLLQKFGSAKAIFNTPLAELLRVEGVQKSAIEHIGSVATMKTAEREMAFMEHKKIHLIAYDDPLFPLRLRQLESAPVYLFCQGNIDLMPTRALGIVGTRTPTARGLAWVEQLLHDLAPHKITIMSGMALGIDGAAHKHALDNGLPTIGILAHGLDRMYPPEHRQIADRILVSGGCLLTEYPSGRKPAREHFPMRNRVIAGMSDAVIVVESAETGGSMITAALTTKFNRVLFAVPGHPSEKYAAGSNKLLLEGKAKICLNAKQVLTTMQWASKNMNAAHQVSLFATFLPAEQTLLQLLATHPDAHIELLSGLSGFSHGELAALLLELEMKNCLQCLPGKRYRLLNN